MTLREMKADPILRKWQMVKCHFQGLQKHRVAPDIWQRIKAVVTERNPEIGRKLEEQDFKGVTQLRNLETNFET